MKFSISTVFRKLRACLGKGWRGVRSAGRWYKGQYKGRPWWYKTLTALWSFLLFIVLYVLAVSTNFLWLFGKSPTLDEIIHPQSPAASEIYSADGKLLGKFFSENRSPVPYDSINPVFFEALVATEDERFFRHHGIDYKGMVAAVKDGLQGRPRGASTISQQLVKNMFRVRTKYGTGLLGKIPGMGILIMKSKEMIIATEIELFCDKRRILELYANTVDFGSNAYGIKTAAKTYFNTTPRDLKTEEAAVLVGLLRATTAYNPKINPENSRRRRNTVLDNMYAHREMLEGRFGKCHVPDQATLRRLKDTPIRLNFSVESVYDGKALYFREALKDYIEKECPELDVYSDGLKIHTTLDSRMQDYAEKALREQMRQVQRNFNAHWRNGEEPWRDENGDVIPGFIEEQLRKTDAYRMLAARFPNSPDSVRHYLNLPHPVTVFGYDGPETKTMSTADSLRHMVRFMHAGLVAMEPETGEVKAYVGDIDFKTWQHDNVRARHQPGSTFKLFVYATAMKNGLTPADRRKDEDVRLEVDKGNGETEIWEPHNSSGRSSYRDMTLREAFARSTNTVAVKLGQEVGIPNVIQTAHDMGIRTELQDVPSLALGSGKVSLFEIVNAYGTVAHGGLHVEPVLVTRIVDREGNVVFEPEREETRALPQTAAFYMQQLLKAGVYDAGGTSQALGAGMYLGPFAPHMDMGGKTGTSNNYADAWFVGVTPSLVAGAWVGGEYGSIHFRTGALGQGSRTALPIVARFMRSVMEDADFQKKYVHKYGEPPTGADIDLLGYYEEPDTAATDSLAADSLAADSLDLMGIGGGQTEAVSEPGQTAPHPGTQDGGGTPPQHPSAPGEAQPPAPARSQGSPHARKGDAPRRQEPADNLLE